jgi:hypothetical protein
MLAPEEEIAMQRLSLTIMLALALWALPQAPASAAEGQDAATQAKCLKAEVNPITGHVLCVEPLGAPVDPAPSAAENPCRENPRAEGDWSFKPTCRTAPAGS